MRIYHPYWLWEDFKAGFYDNCSGQLKVEYFEKIKEMFYSQRLTQENMFYVVYNWRYSCEHNLTNPSMNLIAYIGQAACCVYCNAPSTVTMEYWSKLPKEIQDRANLDAEKALNIWKNNNKYIQLCLNID